MGDGPTSLFVYGTLKRGHANHSLVEPYVRSVVPAWLRGELYCVREFPMLLEGSRIVRGEILRMEPEAMRHVLPLVDDLEEYWPEDPEESLYLRRVVDVMTYAGDRVSAYTYFYNQRSRAAGRLGSLSRMESGEWTGSP